MSFDYEESIWGKGTATLKIFDPTSIRLQRVFSSLKNLNQNDKILEIGCGAGQFIRGVKKFNQNFECYGVDISQNAIDTAKELNHQVHYFKQDSKELPFTDNFFNGIIILDVLEHAPEWMHILAEANRVLKPGGIIYIFVPCERSRISLWNLLNKMNIGKDLTKKYAGHINYFKPNEVLSELMKYNYKIKKSYSEHILGQLLGVFAFFAMEKKSIKSGLKQINNEQFFSDNESRFVRIIKYLVNSLIYIESWALQMIPSPNLHICARKPGVDA